MLCSFMTSLLQMIFELQTSSEASVVTYTGVFVINKLQSRLNTLL